MNYLSPDDIVQMHDEIVHQTGGALGVREPGLLVSLAEKPKTSFGDEELYKDIFTKAASLYEGLCNYHVFIDGNKRISAIAMYRFLFINGYNLTATNDELESYTLHIANKNPEITDVATWIKSHAERIKK